MQRSIVTCQTFNDGHGLCLVDDERIPDSAVEREGLPSDDDKKMMTKNLAKKIFCASRPYFFQS